jgi:hypothetical protein
MRNQSPLKYLKVARPFGKGRGLPAASLYNPWPVALTAVACLLTSFIVPLWAAGGWQVLQQKGGDLLEVSALKGGHHTLEIDDAFAFRTPVVKKTFSGSKLQFHALDLGLIPGIDYHVRLDGGSEVKDIRIVSSTFTEPEMSCVNLRRTWEETGRWVVGNSASRVGWDAAKSNWVVLPHDPLIGQSLYPVEYYLRVALNGARACHDLEAPDEVAKYYVAMLQFTEPVGTLLRRPNVMRETRERMPATDQSARTFPANIGGQPADGELYNVQWLHPAAELLRLISLLPPERRTAAMQDFAGQYTKFIVVDQLDRYLVQQTLPAPGGGQVAGRIRMWELAMRGLKGETPWSTAIFDIDLWLVASAADVLGANANDPTLAPLDAHQAEMLHRAVETGIRFFQSRRNPYPGTKNFRGEQVGSITFGNGDYTAHPDFDYSGVTSEKFPAPSQKLRNANAGWDLMHAYRLPVFERVLYENRKATGSEWPQYHDLQLFANQYVYRVFNGDYSRPLFLNFLDGSDGWLRVGYHGGEFGYPPSPYCNQHDPQHPCLTPGQIMGWGRLAFVNPDLARIEQALVKLALDANPEAQRFRDRYYFYGNAFGMIGAPDRQIYGTPLYFVVGDNAEMIANPSPGNAP